MSEMVERVARAIWDAGFDRMPEPPWEETTELQKRFHRMLAREAIRTMREPTEAMLRSGPFAWSMGYGDEPWVSPENAAKNWRAMIDAALGT